MKVCRSYAEQHGFTVQDKHVYVDEAVSGSVLNRPGLQALQKAIEAHELDAVVVDDLSRLSRGNHQMLTLVLSLNYQQIKLISVSDGIATSDENAKLGKSRRGFLRTRLQPIRTAAGIRVRIKILPARQPYPYQRLAPKVAQLRLLGMTYHQIAGTLGICENTAFRAVKSHPGIDPMRATGTRVSGGDVPHASGGTSNW